LDGGGRGGGFAAGDADDAEDGDLGESGARDEDAVGVGIEIGRSDLDAVVEEGQEIVGEDAFEGLAIEEAEAEPKAVEFGAAKKGFALGCEVVIEIADEINGANAGERKLLVFAIVSEEIEGIELAEARGIEIPAHGFVVVEFDDDLFVGGGWSAKFQRTGFAPC